MFILKVKTMSARAKKNKTKRHPTPNANVVETQSGGKGIPAPSPAIQKAMGMIQQEQYAQAATSLTSAGRDPMVRNTLGVCFLRMGSVDSAVDVFRSFVLMPGTVLERPEVSNASKRNFATALLMKGFPSGALSVLAEIHEPDHPTAVRLYAAIRQWEKSLSWFRWLDWKLNGVEPRKCHIQLDFEPGEFDIEVQAKKSIASVKARKSSLKLAA